MKKRVYLERPDKSAIRALPSFQGLAKSQIVLLRNLEHIHLAEEEIARVATVGFDTESKPVFTANQPRSGPHLIQIATEHRAFLCPVDFAVGLEFIRKLVSSDAVTKVGFGIKSDRGPLQRVLGIKLRKSMELSGLIQRIGYRHKVGLQMAVAVVLGQYLQKSKRVTTSNWAAPVLSDAQLLYAANDAYASLRVHLALEMMTRNGFGAVQPGMIADRLRFLSPRNVP